MGVGRKNMFHWNKLCIWQWLSRKTRMFWILAELQFIWNDKGGNSTTRRRLGSKWNWTNCFDKRRPVKQFLLWVYMGRCRRQLLFRHSLSRQCLSWWDELLSIHSVRQLWCLWSYDGYGRAVFATKHIDRKPDESCHEIPNIATIKSAITANNKRAIKAANKSANSYTHKCAHIHSLWSLCKGFGASAANIQICHYVQHHRSMSG